ncbi:hypothetical protein D9V84_11155 [Bacteroidetes/Chlorobi group bacterium Naka2016]|jgi:hypothetical protein|nr:MAG: hypothetical protein D9V84_11155 [Bacteroidetes/Chlorobi group bacterium Naka2016]
MERAMFITSILVNLATMLSILVALANAMRKAKIEQEERHERLVQEISAQKDKEFLRDEKILNRIKELENSYDNEIGIMKMNIQQIDTQRAIESEKLRASVEKLMVSIEGLNDRVSELVKRVSEIEKLTKVLYEFIGYTKGEKNAKRKTNQ